MKQLLILVGLHGNPNKNWYPYLKAEALKMGYRVFVPESTDPGKPNLELTYHQAVSMMDFSSDTVIVGHSSGAVLALGILQKLTLSKPIKRTILVGGFVDTKLTDYLFTQVPIESYINNFPLKWDWEKIKANSQDFVVVHSPDDPFVPFEQAVRLERYLNARLVSLEGMKHFSISTVGERMKEFPELLKFI